LISDDAIRQVGRAMFGDHWIDAITARETWLIERYVEGRGRGRGAQSILPGMTSWEIGGRRWSQYPSDPALVAEVERAQDRSDWCDQQWQQAFRWLKDLSLNAAGHDVDRAALHAAIAVRWGAKPANKGGRPPAVDWAVVKGEAIRLMNYYGEFGADEPEWNAQARLEEKLEHFCQTRFGVTPADSTLRVHVKPWITEWRESKTPSAET
jgi:hypothetical protein